MKVLANLVKISHIQANKFVYSTLLKTQSPMTEVHQPLILVLNSKKSIARLHNPPCLVTNKNAHTFHELPMSRILPLRLHI